MTIEKEGEEFRAIAIVGPNRCLHTRKKHPEKGDDDPLGHSLRGGKETKTAIHQVSR